MIEKGQLQELLGDEGSSFCVGVGRPEQTKCISSTCSNFLSKLGES
jgi:hypothetical protein